MLHSYAHKPSVRFSTHRAQIYKIMTKLMNTDFTKILKRDHEGKWVALSEDGTTVIAYDENLLELDKKVGDTKVVYMKVPLSDVSYAF